METLVWHKIDDSVTDSVKSHAESHIHQDKDQDDLLCIGDQDYEAFENFFTESDPEEDCDELGFITEYFQVQGDDDDGSFYPFPSKIFAFLYCLLHSPRPIGEANAKFIWFMLKSCFANVPSFWAVKCFEMPGYSPPIKEYANDGTTPFYLNHISQVLKLCLENPQIARLLVRYPVTANSSFKEIYHGNRWNFDDRFAAPMATLSNGENVFLHDVITYFSLELGLVLCIVKRFFMKEDSNNVYVTVTRVLTLDQLNIILGTHFSCHDPNSLVIYDEFSSALCEFQFMDWNIPTTLMKLNSEKTTLISVSVQDVFPTNTPSSRESVYIVPLILYSDDLSGNRSKKWNKLDCWCMFLAGLPKNENAKFSNIHLLCCSDQVSAIEMAPPIAKELSLLESKGLEVYDGFLQKTITIICPVLCALCDNPRSSELCNHLGSAANKFCRMCLVDKKNPAGLDTLRSSEQSQLFIQEIQAEVTEVARGEKRTECGLKDIPNPLLHLKVDMYRSTPVEVLHTILLGPYKYLLKDIISQLGKQHKKEVLARVAAFNYSGFETKLVANVCYHHQSFVGRDYKTWAQMALFIIGPYLNIGDRLVWLTLSQVFKIAYVDMFSPDKYLEWKGITFRFVQAIQQHKPALLSKQKVHLLLHLVDNMLDFGPTSAFCTERCESFNGYIRTLNLFSNRHCVSRDIAKKASVSEHLNYICSGCNNVGSENRQAGSGLVKLYADPEVQRFFGYQSSSKILYQEKLIYQPGTLRKKKQECTVEFILIFMRGFGTHTVRELRDIPFIRCFSLGQLQHVTEFGGVIARDRSLVNVGDFVALENQDKFVLYGELLACVHSTCSYDSWVIVRPFDNIEDSRSMKQLEDEYLCPLLEMTSNVYLFPALSVLQPVSVVHCCTESCTFKPTGHTKKIEREDVPTNNLLFEHDWNNLIYSFNVYCLKSLVQK